MNILLLCASILIFLYFLLSLNVSKARIQMRKSQLSKEKVEQRIETHANASEYIPLLIAIFIFLSPAPTNWFIYSIAITATISRIFHAIGMTCIEKLGQRHPLMFLGALGTYISLFVFGVIFLIKAF